MARAPDEEIVAWSLEQKATVVTLDADFHAILAVSGASGPSVIRIRRQGLDAIAVVELIEKALVEYEFELARGCLVTINAVKTTSHKLPIRRTRITFAVPILIKRQICNFGAMRYTST